MKKIIREVDKKRGIMQVTTLDERWYSVPNQKDPITGNPFTDYYPSSTFITSFYPKGKFFQEWLKKNGEEAELIKMLAGEKGSKIHQAKETLMKGETIQIDQKFLNTNSELLEELTPEEYEAVKSFQDFWESLNSKHKVARVSNEEVVISNNHKYAGTIDDVWEVDGELWVVDLKTGQNVYEDYKLQISSYKQAMTEQGEIGHIKRVKTDDYKIIRMFILQVGYKRNKNKWKLTEIEDAFNLFLHTKAIWENEVGQKMPRQIELPLSLKLAFPGEKAKENKKELKNKIKKGTKI